MKPYKLEILDENMFIEFDQNLAAILEELLEGFLKEVLLRDLNGCDIPVPRNMSKVEYVSRLNEMRIAFGHIARGAPECYGNKISEEDAKKIEEESRDGVKLFSEMFWHMWL